MKKGYEKRGVIRYDVMMKILEILELEIKSKTDVISEIRQSSARIEVVESGEAGENHSDDTISDLEEAIYEMCTNNHMRSNHSFIVTRMLRIQVKCQGPGPGFEPGS